MDTSPKDCLYVSDLDGTLLGPGGHFPDANADRLNRLIERGLKFSIATARSYDSAHPILHRVNFQIPVILFNGVYLTEFATGNVLQLSNFIPHEAVHVSVQAWFPVSDAREQPVLARVMNRVLVDEQVAQRLGEHRSCRLRGGLQP